MSYLVMECHPGYAVVLDEEGRFRKVANLNYEVGQTIFSVIEIKEPAAGQKRGFSGQLAALTALAACLCLFVLGSFGVVLTPYGSVRMQINPDVRLTVNRLDYVIALEGLNEDGKSLAEGYEYRWKKVDRVSDELADRAMELGYLKEGGTIRLTVESEHEKWKKETEDRIILELEVHVGGSITVTPVSGDDVWDDWDDDYEDDADDRDDAGDDMDDAGDDAEDRDDDADDGADDRDDDAEDGEDDAEDGEDDADDRDDDADDGEAGDDDMDDREDAVDAADDREDVAGGHADAGDDWEDAADDVDDAGDDADDWDDAADDGDDPDAGDDDDADGD